MKWGDLGPSLRRHGTKARVAGALLMALDQANSVASTPNPVELMGVDVGRSVLGKFCAFNAEELKTRWTGTCQYRWSFHLLQCLVDLH